MEGTVALTGCRSEKAFWEKGCRERVGVPRVGGEGTHVSRASRLTFLSTTRLPEENSRTGGWRSAM